LANDCFGPAKQILRHRDEPTQISIANTLVW
jgi:hypothetical protein